jgi:hypothetical protein
VSEESEKPFTLSIGKIIGLVAVLLLFVSPFLPYRIHDDIRDGVFRKSLVSTYIEAAIFGGMRFLPIISAILIGILLFSNMKIYTVRNSKYVKIDHFILMLWGGWFFLTYLEQVIEHTHSGDYGDVYPGIGLWMMLAGSFLCVSAGFLEWRYPTITVAGVPKMIPKRKPKPEVVPETTTVPPVAVETERVQSVPSSKEAIQRPEHSVESEPVTVQTPAVTRPVELFSREPESEEEKKLMQWAEHINPDGKVFEQCVKCNKFGFLNTKDTNASIIFECTQCGESFILNKKSNG